MWIICSGFSRMRNKQLGQLKGTNYAFFGGKEEFERMVARAEAAAK